jgi:plasmid stabilization system protein ParE
MSFKVLTGAEAQREWDEAVSVYFAVNEEHQEVKVLAIWHGARNPAELRRRLK